MTHAQTCTAYIIDDDEAIRDSLSWLLRTRQITSCNWASAESFLTDYRSDMRGCLILDIRMHGMGGPELFQHLLNIGCRMPVIFLTGHGDVPLAVEAIKRGAFDFIEKPLNDNYLVDRVLEALQLAEELHRQECFIDEREARLESLSAREREVMERILAGKYNKVIADELRIAMRTVEVHRANIFEKMRVRSAVERAGLMSDVRN